MLACDRYLLMLSGTAATHQTHAVYGQRFHHGECFYSQFCYGTLVDAMAEIVDGKVIVIQRAMGDSHDGHVSTITSSSGAFRTAMGIGSRFPQ